MMRELEAGDSGNMEDGAALPPAREFDEEKFKCDVYFMCREGFPEQLTNCIAQAKAQVGLERVKELLNAKYQDDAQLCAPLLVASKEGHVEICDLLIYEYNVDVETEGTILFDGFKIEGATPLWCSAGANHMTIVMMLIKFGADVNHSTRSRSTPLRAACFDGRLEMVKLLLDHKADYNIANKFENTCLMIATFRGHKDVVKCLLSLGAPVNARALCGNSALQFAAEAGNIEIIHELMQFGADIRTVNKNGMTPLLSAAERTQAHAVEYFVDLKCYPREENIDALEVLGASYANDKDTYDLERCYHYLRVAMLERAKEPVITKKLPPPVPAYENRVECQTLEELEQIKYNANTLQMESLAIRERILGSHNTEVPHHVTFRGAVFADSADFDRSLELWLHALTLRRDNNICLLQDLVRFAQLFCQMLHLGVPVSVEVLRRVLETAACQLEVSNMHSSAQKKAANHTDDEHEIVLTILYLLVVLSKVLLREPKEKEELFDLVRRINASRCVTREGNSLLHLAVDEDTPVNDFHTRNLCRFPCANTAKLLIRCNANVNAINKERNTPLHIIMKYSNPSSNFKALHSIMSELIRNGAHTDTVNARGQTPLDAASTSMARTLLRFQLEIKLKCIAAKAVQKHGLQYEGIVPTGLIGFIENHGRREDKVGVEKS
ncbi:protein fem-1 homolog B [Galendromus occidentalis]|uniref:Protein fem-1 homolog B n=1 Tax=Galendromus occidentalis TaxID=34638 RepID=A0AAJ7PA40_9ACAR|nr:protein fem-1 homolog B [Galendromus occidentalis]